MLQLIILLRLVHPVWLNPLVDGSNLTLEFGLSDCFGLVEDCRSDNLSDFELKYPVIFGLRTLSGEIF